MDDTPPVKRRKWERNRGNKSIVFLQPVNLEDDDDDPTIVDDENSIHSQENLPPPTGGIPQSVQNSKIITSSEKPKPKKVLGEKNVEKSIPKPSKIMILGVLRGVLGGLEVSRDAFWRPWSYQD